MKNAYFLLLMVVCLSSCSDKYTPEKHPLAAFRLLSKADAATVITTDTHEGYFDKVQPLEMAIQMNNPIHDSPRDTVLTLYKKFLQDDIQDFLAKESDLVKKTMRQALDLCAKVNPHLPLPAEIVLIKAQSRNYGPKVFYTRNNSIVIPADMLVEKEAANLLRILIHEIFHLYSRHNPDKRQALYQLLGFERLNKPIALSPFLQKRILYNPDAVDIGYGIQLKNAADSTFTAIPVLYSKFGRVDIGGFFGHLVFQLFEVSPAADSFRIVAPDVGLQPTDVQGFFEKIGRNTQYIIHPEEVAADNFQLLVFSKDDSLKTQVNIPAEGNVLLQSIQQIVQ